MMHKLQEKLVLARLELHEVTLEDLDVEAVLGFAEEILLDAPRLWIEFNLDQKQRFQRVVFPEGLVFEDGGFRTAVTNPIFSYLQGFHLQNEEVVARTGFEPNSSVPWSVF